ncbi:hypothetical protein LB521_27980 [Mesorhizobium sp. BR-1-1-8]|uniref:hypothetical protein n=1 Tax=Mesorhizobium sp. BR-1-1-8 TaxID=2876659 RepID=UPI001CCCFE24|nr:hypothetical protein [Mesorhizobium sp. BR-1-1-8]MBZ9984978.1 hypothetical protein [Mesorhizobium sp. BR-1-1-8]
MAEWRLKRGMPEYHQVMLYRETLRDGTLIEAYTEDCDGDVEYWGVKENGVLVASGATDCAQDEARLAAEQVICFGATAEQRLAAMAKTDRESA